MANKRGWGGARPNSGPKIPAWKTRATIEKLLQRHNLNNDNADGVIDPLSWWMMILNDPEAPNSRRDMAAAKLAEFTVAKPKAIHSDGSSNSRIEVIITDFTKPTTETITTISTETLLLEPSTNDDEDDAN